MSDTVTARQVIDASRAQIPILRAEVGRIDSARGEHEQQLGVVNRELNEAWQYLATVLVPDLQADHLDWASQLLSLPPLRAATVAQGIAREREHLQTTIADIEGQETYARREAILNECSIHLAELADSLEPLAMSVPAFEAQTYWDELLQTGYGTDAYTGKWWNMSYYRHWKHADMALRAMGEELGIETFAELRARYEEEKAALHQLRSTAATYDSRQHDVHTLVAQHTRVASNLENLEPRHLTQARAKVIEHLMALPRPEIATMVASYEPGVVAIKRIAGLEAKLRYLQLTFEKWVLEPEAGVRKALRKAERDVYKLARPKHFHRRFSSVDFERRFADRSGKWNKRWGRYQDSRSQIVDFDEYGRYDFADDTPWWPVMTADRVKARFIPEVETYYQQRSGSAGTRGDDEDHAFAALAGQGLGDDEPFDDMS